jgi:hypothetical protein
MPRLTWLRIMTGIFTVVVITVNRPSDISQHGVQEAARIGDRLYSEKLARIYWATPEEERTAFAWFKRYRTRISPIASSPAPARSEDDVHLMSYSGRGHVADQVRIRSTAHIRLSYELA